jgi:ArsR family transcriptional regulator
MGSSGGMNTVKLANIMKALSNPNRLELYLEIAKKNQASFQTGGECFVTDIINSFDIGAPTISHHLKELTKAGLISTERRGKYLVATVNVKAIDEVSAVLAFPQRKK